MAINDAYSRAGWHSVRGYEDGEPVDAAVLNRPIGELTSRTDYLKRRLDAFSGAFEKTSVRIEVRLSDDDTPVVGDIVSIDGDTGLCGKAIASMDLYDAYVASASAYAVGMLVDRTGKTGTVVLYGLADLSGLDMFAMVEDGEFEGGAYYLSSTSAGKITMRPKGPRILVGFFHRNPQADGAKSGSTAIINPQHMDIESHAHRTFALEARPCGRSCLENGAIVVRGYLPSGASAYDVPDSTDSTDSAESAAAQAVYAGIPSLVVGGDWTSRVPEDYDIVVEPVMGSDLSTWPVTIGWRRHGSDADMESTRVYMFGQEVRVGGNGMTVRLEPAPGQDENSPYGEAAAAQAQEDESIRLWTLGRDDGRGWAPASVNVTAQVVPDGGESEESEESAGCIVFGGVADREVNHVAVLFPESVYVLSDLAVPEDGDVLQVDGVSYTFTDDPDDRGDGHVPIADRDDAYASYAQLASFVDGLCYDDSLGIVLAAADSVSFKGEPLPPVSVGGYYAVAFVDGGRSVAPSVDVSGRMLPLLPVGPDSYRKVYGLRNGLTAAVLGSETGFGTGLAAHAVVYCVPGAKYRYNIDFDNDFKFHFPPVPARSGSLMLNGVEVESTEHYGDAAVLAVGDDSLYWRDASDGRQPWPLSVMARTDAVEPEDEYRELFHFVSEFHSETGPVTSLRPASGAPLRVRRCGTDEDATVGDLELDVDLMVDASDQGLSGYKVPKASRNGRLLLGPVVEKVVAGPGISISTRAGSPAGQGTVTISADGASYSGDFETVALENAKLESVGMFPYVRLLRWDPDSRSNVRTGFVAKFHLPTTMALAEYRARFYLTVFGEESFSGLDSPRHAGLEMSYSILPDFTPMAWSGEVIETSNLKTGVISDDPVTLSIPFGADPGFTGKYGYQAYDPILAHNDASLETELGKSVRVLEYSLPGNGLEGLRPGWTVAIRFTRCSPPEDEVSSAYMGALGVMNMRWVLEETSGVANEVLDQVDADLVVQAVRNLRKVASRHGVISTAYDIADAVDAIMRALR